jgi:uncharacterized membrane protein YeaQ/YmgE (transglycosylase-associated protein family)
MTGCGWLIVIAVAAMLLLALAFAIMQSFVGLLLALVVALVAGIIGERVTGGTTGGALATVLCGLAGAVVGIIIAEVTGLPRLISLGGLPLIWTIVGSIITVAVWSQIRARTDVGEDEV